MDQENSLFEILESNGIVVDENQKTHVVQRLSDMLTYTPSIGVFGKTGAGKSSLCNALFGKELYLIDDVRACTRCPQEEFLKISDDGSIRLLDVPGVGENLARDKEYAELYLSLIPKLDAIIWLIKADDRALSSDENFFKNILLPYIRNGMPFLIVLNQVDKIEPFREWDDEKHEPGLKQWVNIERKKSMVANFFQVPLSKVIAISASEKYNLVNLVSELIYAIPVEKQFNVYSNISNEYQTQQMDDFISSSTEKSIADIVTDVLEVANSPVAKEVYDCIKESKIGKELVRVGKKVIKHVGKFISKIAKIIFGKIF